MDDPRVIDPPFAAHHDQSGGDAPAGERGTSCPSFHRELMSGTLRLDRAELARFVDVHGSLELSLEGGHRVSFEF